jgi:hypothetical protein
VKLFLKVWFGRTPQTIHREQFTARTIHRRGNSPQTNSPQKKVGQFNAEQVHRKQFTAGQFTAEAIHRRGNSPQRQFTTGQFKFFFSLSFSVQLENKKPIERRNLPSQTFSRPCKHLFEASL